jgi:hypothetical protein
MLRCRSFAELGIAFGLSPVVEVLPTFYSVDLPKCSGCNREFVPQSEGASAQACAGCSEDSIRFDLDHAEWKAADSARMDVASIPPIDVEILKDTDLPKQFQYPNIYNADDIEATQAAFRQWCAENRVYYYARPKEQFFSWTARELAAKAGCRKLLLEDMS